MEKVYDREFLFMSRTLKTCLMYQVSLPPTSVWKAIQTNYYEQGNHSKNATLALDTVKPQIFLIYNLLIHVIKWLKPLNSAQYTF